MRPAGRAAWWCFVAGGLAVALPVSMAGPAGAQEPRTRVVLLGTGTPNADPERSGPATAVVVDGRAYLVDAGPGVVRRAARAARAHGIGALRPANLGHVFVTHLHSDHTVGLPDLLLGPWVLGRPEPLRVYGPPGTVGMMDGIARAWSADVETRLDGLAARGNNRAARVTSAAAPDPRRSDEGIAVATSRSSNDGDGGRAAVTPNS